MQDIFSPERIDEIKKVNDKLFNVELMNSNREASNNIIFIYTPPKVGSTSLVSSIRLSASHKYSVIHIHDEIMLNYMTGTDNKVTINELIKYNKYIGKNVFVIDIYRTPIERKISEYFEKLSCYHFNNSEENLNNYKLDIIIKRFNCLFPFLGNGDHFYEKYEIDTENIQFNFKELHIHNIQNGVHYIKLRLNDSKSWGNILTKILNTEIIIISEYKTNDKKIGTLYSKFKELYKIPMNYFELIKNDKFLNMYLSTEEVKKYLNIWENKKTCDNFEPYSQEQYNFYINLCIENQYFNDFQLDHYIDNGCLCNLCSHKRKVIFEKIKNGYEIKDKLKDKIIHHEVVNEIKEKKIEKIKSISKQIVNNITKSKNKSNKLNDNSFHFKNLNNDKFKQNMGTINFT